MYESVSMRPGTLRRYKVKLYDLDFRVATNGISYQLQEHPSEGELVLFSLNLFHTISDLGAQGIAKLHYLVCIN